MMLTALHCYRCVPGAGTHLLQVDPQYMRGQSICDVAVSLGLR